MNEKEFKEILEMLRKAGIWVKACDAALPMFRNGIPAGVPNEILQECEKEWYLIPRSMVSGPFSFFTVVKGHSMKDGGICNGDIVRLEVCDNYKEGDIVAAFANNESTLKVYHEDENGEPWLVPMNEDFKPIRLLDYDNIRFVGKVVSVEHPAPRTSYRDIQRAMRSLKEDENTITPPSDELVRKTIMAECSVLRKRARLWFCIYRALVDSRYIKRSLNNFEMKMNELFAGQELNINVYDLSRIEVGCFCKPIKLWNEYDAPVKGKTFEMYDNMAKKVLAKFMG